MGRTVGSRKATDWIDVALASAVDKTATVKAPTCTLGLSVAATFAAMVIHGVQRAATAHIAQLIVIGPASLAR
jgi:hypothetical protein